MLWSKIKNLSNYFYNFGVFIVSDVYLGCHIQSPHMGFSWMKIMKLEILQNKIFIELKILMDYLTLLSYITHKILILIIINPSTFHMSLIFASRTKNQPCLIGPLWFHLTPKVNFHYHYQNIHIFYISLWHIYTIGQSFKIKIWNTQIVILFFKIWHKIIHRNSKC